MKNTFIEFGFKKLPLSDKIIEAARRIKNSLDCDDCGLGGYGHIVFEDWNLDMIQGCIDDAEDVRYPALSEECRMKSLLALKYCQTITEEELANALAVAGEYYNDITIQDEITARIFKALWDSEAHATALVSDDAITPETIANILNEYEIAMHPK